MAPRRKNAEIHHVDFMKLNRRWVALIYIDPNTSVSQQTVGTKKNVEHIIKTQLDPHGIPYTIEGMTEMTNYPTYMVKAGLVPNPKHSRGKWVKIGHEYYYRDSDTGETLAPSVEDTFRTRDRNHKATRYYVEIDDEVDFAGGLREAKAFAVANMYRNRNPSRKANAGASPLKFSFQWSKGGGSVKFRKGPVGKVGRIEVSVRPTNTFHAYLYEDAPNWVLMKDYINVGRSDGYTHQKDVPYATKVTVWKAAQKALEKETGLSPTPRAQPRRRKNAGLNEVTVKFKNSKYNYETEVSSNTTAKSAHEYFVGQYFDVGSYPKENMQRVIGIDFNGKPVAAKSRKRKNPTYSTEKTRHWEGVEYVTFYNEDSASPFAWAAWALGFGSLGSGRSEAEVVERARAIISVGYKTLEGRKGMTKLYISADEQAAYKREQDNGTT
jgi:hypothetical protein